MSFPNTNSSSVSNNNPTLNEQIDTQKKVLDNIYAMKFDDDPELDAILQHFKDGVKVVASRKMDQLLYLINRSQKLDDPFLTLVIFTIFMTRNAIEKRN